MKYKNIHFVGIKGVGMTPLAVIAKEAGCAVTGSDVENDFITKIPLEKAGIQPLIGFDEDHITHADLVVNTGAHGGSGNIEVQKAKEKNVKVVSQAEFIALLIDGEIAGKKFDCIAIAGTHGKTTTTAMVATILAESGVDPSYLIGTSNIPTLPAPGHYGEGKYFVLEADEYATDPVHNKKPKFLWQHPKIAVFTNIEHDHMDIYESLNDIRNAFNQLARQVQEGGVLIAYGDDSEVQKILKDFSGQKITYGFSEANDYVLKRVTVSKDFTFFRVDGRSTDLGEFAISVTGEHNALNALASIIVAIEIGLPIEKIRQALKLFKGSKRRFEYIGQLRSGALLYDDYAHHPTEIKKTLHAIRQLYPEKKIMTIFQPHTYSRTKNLFDQFVGSFGESDTVVITDIYASARESVDPSISSEKLVQSLTGVHREAIHLSKISDVVEYIKEKNLTENYVILTMGAGDIYMIKDQLELIEE